MEHAEGDWISKRVDEALKAFPVADGVVSIIKERLAETMRERALRTGEMTELAKSLVEATANPPPEEVGK